MSRRYFCHKCNPKRDITELVNKKLNANMSVMRNITISDEDDYDEIIVTCPEGHKNLFKIPNY